MPEMSFCTMDERKPNQFILPHTHTCHELVFYGQGCHGITVIDGAEHALQKGAVALIPKDVVHEELHLALTEVTFFGFQMSGLNLQGVWYDMWYLKPLFDDILQEVCTQEYRYNELISLKIQEILAYLARKEYGNQVLTKDLSSCKSYIEENYMQKVNVGMLAQATGYSYDHFRHLYKERYGISPQQDLVRKRIENAIRLLKNTSLSCTEIAYQCGFSDSGQMTKMLRTYHGMTPSVIRKGILERN